MKFAVKSCAPKQPAVTFTLGSAACRTPSPGRAFCFPSARPWTTPVRDVSPDQEAASPPPPLAQQRQQVQPRHQAQPHQVPQQQHRRQYRAAKHRHRHPTGSFSATKKILLSPAALSVNQVRLEAEF